MFREILHTIQEGRCFYCLSTLAGDASDIEHFVPWTRYSLDRERALYALGIRTAKLSGATVLSTKDIFLPLSSSWKKLLLSP